MNTSKEITINACKIIAKEYRSKKGHELAAWSCPLCKLYWDNNCIGCPLSIFETENSKGCVNTSTYGKGIINKTDELVSSNFVKSPIRAKFYDMIILELENIDAKYFTEAGFDKSKFEAIRKWDNEELLNKKL